MRGTGIATPASLTIEPGGFFRGLGDAAKAGIDASHVLENAAESGLH